MIKRGLIVVHRWLGVVLCLLFLLWFASGIGMMYWTYPSVSAADRLDRAPALDPATVILSPTEVAGRLGIVAIPGQTYLNTFDGRPVYRFGGGTGRGRVVYADTGEERVEVPPDQRDRIAAAWTGQPVAAATVEPVVEADQWTLLGAVRTLRPLYRYSWPNGEQLYITGETGEVMQYTTRASRLGAYVSAIPHWLYFTPLRTRASLWLEVVIWTALIGTVSAVLGLVIGAWMYSPGKRYRLGGRPTAVPYRGQKRLHAILGLVFGLGAVTWGFSGMLSMDPFPTLMARLQPVYAEGGVGREDVARALRGRVEIRDFAEAHPREALGRNPQLGIRELEFTSFAGEPLFAANLGSRGTRMLALDGTPVATLDTVRIAAIVRGLATDPDAVETRVIHQYDLHYRDRTRQRPLPVMRVVLNDDRRTRYYIDPRTARVVGGYDRGNWIGRWLYNGLHSLDFPWLYNHRPLWDIVVITFMLGGTALSLTGVILAWRVVGRRIGF